MVVEKYVVHVPGSTGVDTEHLKRHTAERECRQLQEAGIEPILRTIVVKVPARQGIWA